MPFIEHVLCVRAGAHRLTECTRHAASAVSIQALCRDEETVTQWALTPAEITEPGLQSPGRLTPESRDLWSASPSAGPPRGRCCLTTQLAKDVGLVGMTDLRGLGGRCFRRGALPEPPGAAPCLQTSGPSGGPSLTGALKAFLISHQFPLLSWQVRKQHFLCPPTPTPDRLSSGTFQAPPGSGGTVPSAFISP